MFVAPPNLEKLKQIRIRQGAKVSVSRVRFCRLTVSLFSEVSLSLKKNGNSFSTTHFEKFKQYLWNLLWATTLVCDTSKWRTWVHPYLTGVFYWLFSSFKSIGLKKHELKRHFPYAVGRRIERNYWEGAWNGRELWTLLWCDNHQFWLGQGLWGARSWDWQTRSGTTMGPGALGHIMIIWGVFWRNQPVRVKTRHVSTNKRDIQEMCQCTSSWSLRVF